MSVTVVCSYCKSDNVLRDAYVSWSVEDQDWVIQNVFDAAYCCQCGGETSLEEQNLEETIDDKRT